MHEFTSPPERRIEISVQIPKYRGGAMSTKALLPLIAAAFLCSPLPAWSQNQLPDGKAKETVQTACVGCHALTTVTNAGHSREQWATALHMMVNVGANVQQDQFATVLDYLAKNFPEKPQPDAVVIPGSVEVSIHEWQVPTPGSRPHDPAVAPNGSAWYTGQMANVLGRLHPQTHQIQEYTPKTPISGPHGLGAG